MEQKELFEKLIKLQSEQHKLNEANSKTLKSIQEMITASNDPNAKKKLSNDPLVEDKLQKMTKDFNSMSDQLKTMEAKQKAFSIYGSESNYAEKLYESDGRHVNWNASVVKRHAKSIFRDPHAATYRKAFLNRVSRKDGTKEKFFAAIEEIKSSSVEEKDSFIKKALTTIVGDSAGYFCPPEIEMEIQKVLFETSPVRMIADTKVTSRGHYEFRVRTSLPTAVWGSTELGVDDTDEQKYALGKISVETLKALPELSLDILEDSDINIEAELRNDLQEAFMLAENKAFIKGTGIEQPRGLEYYAKASDTSFATLKPLKIERVEEAAADFDGDTLLNLEARVLSPYKNKAYYLMSRGVKNVVRQLKTSQGQYLFSVGHGWGAFQGVPQIRDGMHGRVNGYPVVECDDLHSSISNTVGEEYPIYFGNFKKYCILDRIGLTVIRDEVTNKGFLRLFVRKRVGAGLKLAQGIKVLKVT